MEAKTNGKKKFQQKGNNIKSKVNTAFKEQKRIEFENNRKEDFELLKEVCFVLGKKSSDIKDAIVAGTILTNEQKSITMGDVKEQLGDKWVEPNRLVLLTNLLIDIARCNINTKLPDYHKAIRVMYFQEKFEAYFTNKYNDERYDLIRSYHMFTCGNIETVIFAYPDGNEDPMDLYEMGVVCLPDREFNPVTGGDLPIHTNNLMNTADEYINQNKEG